MQLLDGKVAAARVREKVAEEAADLTRGGIVPGLGTILVGDDPASSIYIGAKIKACEEAGIASIHRHLPAGSTEADVLGAVRDFNVDARVHAYIVQLPLPPGVNESRVLLAMDPGKDADGLHPVNLGKLVMGADGPVPCTPAGIVELLIQNEIPIGGKHVVIVGRGLTIGRPLALLLALKRPHANAAVTVVHTGVGDIGSFTRQADIVVMAAGTPGLLKAAMVKPGATVIGAGISREGNRIVSDVDDDVAEVAGHMTPRVGGVGPMTVAMLLQNTVRAAKIAAA